MARTFNLADLFEVVATALPDRTAFIRGDQRPSYRKLDERATRLASALRAGHGARREGRHSAPISRPRWPRWRRPWRR